MNNKKPLFPRRIINTEGSIGYEEKTGSWSLIRLKADVINEFYQLKERRSKFGYKMAYFRTYEELEKAIRELKKKTEEPLPILMFLYKESEN